MSSGVNILLVDDQPARLLSYEAILSDLGHNIVRAESGNEALHRLMRDEFAVILLDVNMPGMDGFETAQLIHQHPRYEKTPIVFVTGLHVTDMDRLRGYGLGAVDYVYLPVIPEILRSKVTVLVDLYLKRRELVQLNESLARANEELALANSTLQVEKTRELEALNLTLETANAKLEQTNRELTAQIAERRRAEESRRLSEERLQTILQHTSALIYQVDVQGRFVHVNLECENLLQRSRAELCGRRLSEVLPGVSREFDANNMSVLELCRPLEFEEVLELPLGTRVHSSVKAPLIDADGIPYGVVGVSTDVTERKRLEVALRDADRRKDEFIAMMAHELRNPLAAIVNGLQLVREKEELDAEFRWARNVLDRQVNHLCRLIEDLLDVSRITHGKITLQRELVDLRSIVERALEATAPSAKLNEHALSIDVPNAPVLVHADPTRLVQIVGNLLNNAVKYTPNGGNIQLRVSCNETEVEICVQDDGAGVSPEMMPTLFHLFSQYDRTLVQSQGGLGIGLALVKRLVEMHGGSVRAHSAGIGQGSEFVVALRRHIHGSASITPLPSAERPARTRAIRILVVDDNVDSAESLAMLLGHLGHELETVHSGAEAVAKAASFAPEVILLDLGMPGMDGYEAARRIRALPLDTEPMLIALTGWSQLEAREATRLAGFDLHLVKPVDLVELQSALAALERRGPGLGSERSGILA